MDEETEEIIKKYEKMRKERLLGEKIGTAIGHIVFLILTACLASCAVAASIRFIMWLFYV